MKLNNRKKLEALKVLVLVLLSLFLELFLILYKLLTFPSRFGIITDCRLVGFLVTYSISV